MGKVHTPNSEDAAAGIVRDAIGAGSPLTICGGRTRSRADRDDKDILSSAGIGGIVDYEPAELVMIARAGTPMKDVEDALNIGGQRLIFEPMDHRPLLGTTGEATIGGVAAANVSGPRRFVAGAARDALLGCRFVNGTGEIITAGGRVMKNVTGLDLVKLMAGSRGTLGLLTEVTFKVVPKPETEMTLVLHGLDPTAAAKAMAAAMATASDVSGAAHVPPAAAGSVEALDGASTVLRLEGFEHSVGIRADKLETALADVAEMTRLDAERSKSIWSAIRDCRPFADGSDQPVWRVSLPPMNGYAFADVFPDGDVFFDWQGGLVWLRLKGDPQAPRVRQAVDDCGGGHATLVRASLALADDIEPRHPEPQAVAALSRRIRETFDPQGVFADFGQSN